MRDEDELPVIQITVLEEEQAKKRWNLYRWKNRSPIRFSRLEAKRIRHPVPGETLTVRETMGRRNHRADFCRVSRGNWMQKTATILEFQGGLAPEDYFDRFDEDGEPEETEEKDLTGRL